MMNRALRIGLLVLCTLIFLRPSFGQMVITVGFAPPPLPVYELPPCPAEGYLWTPGYWAWDPDFGYYWVPGTWILVPQPGFLWTPPWWGWETGGYIFHPGFWGPQVGFYGGINYGFGYFGRGFVGGRWDGGVFRYNTAVLNVNTTIIHNTYIDRTVIVNNVNRVSYNGGEGGIRARPTPEEERVEHMPHIPPVREQEQHIQVARSNPQLRASENHGRPPVAATARPGEFRGAGVVPAREAGGAYHPPANPHAYSIQPHKVTPPNTGDAQRDADYRQQRQQLVDKQNQEHQQLLQRQEADRQQAQQQHYNEQQQMQMSEKHQQEFRQMEQQHTQQMHEMQMQQAPPPRASEPRPR
jgi:WXXGXW repeat (2 copies)